MTPRLGLVVLSLGCTSCLSSLHPRPGETAPAGQWAVDPAFTVATFSRDEAEVRRPDGGTQRRSGLGGEMVDLGGSFAFPTPEVGGRLGLTRWLEGGVQLGPARQAFELREGLLSEGRGDRVSVALAQAVGYQPFASTRSAWLRGGIDISRWFGDTIVMTNWHLSHGAEIHSFVLDVPPSPSAVQIADGPSPSASVRRVETRLLAALSVGFGGPASSASGGPPSTGFFAVGLVPYWVLHSRQTGAECVACAPGYEVTGFRETFGLSLVAHGTVQSWW